jgi:hypothetical protein
MSTPDPTPSDHRAAVAVLVQFQQRASAAGLPADDAAQLHALLAGFPEWVARRGHGQAWAPPQAAAWERIAGLLVGCLLDQPRVALRTAGGPARSGPLFHDIAALLRAEPRDEAVELDLAVRWWQQARAVGLPVDTDFGECWRAIEWTALYGHLVQLGDLYRRQAEGGAAPDEARRAHLLGQAGKVALRYGPLKPLLRLLEPLSGAQVSDGYTF